MIALTHPKSARAEIRSPKADARAKAESEPCSDRKGCAHVHRARPLRLRVSASFGLRIRASALARRSGWLPFLAAAAEKSPNSACLECHSDKTLTTTNAAGKEVSLFVDEAKLMASVHKIQRLRQLSHRHHGEASR